jgi:hypothetical protein
MKKPGSYSRRGGITHSPRSATEAGEFRPGSGSAFRLGLGLFKRLSLFLFAFLRQPNHEERDGEQLDSHHH